MPSRNLSSYELTAKELRWQIDPGSIPYQKSSEIPPCEHIIGQDRALRAIRMGLAVKSHGYNIYVSGLTGTGKKTTIQRLLEQMKSKGETPDDICYVNNFTDPDSPTMLTFKAGQGKTFSKEMDETISYLRNTIPQIYEGENYKEKQKQLIDSYKNKVQTAVEAFEQKVQKAGFSMVQVQAGLTTRPEILPVIQNAVIPWPKMGELIAQGKIKEEDVQRLRQQHDVLMAELEKIAETHQEWEKQTQEELQKLEQNTALHKVKTRIASMKKRFPQKRTTSFLDTVQEHILNNLERFKKTEEDEGKKNSFVPLKKITDHQFVEYKVNVIVDNSKTKGAPIIIETAPTFNNLFGVIERSWDPSGMWRTDFTMIKAGSLLRANGGYLVFDLVEALAEGSVYPILKRTLKNREVIIQGLEAMFPGMSSAIKPEPVKIDVKVLVIGDEYTYRLIYDLDDEFKKIFKIRADFDTEMKNNPKAIKEYLGFISKICKTDDLLPLDRSALACVIEHGVTLTSRKNKISTRFSDVADIVREAQYWAKEDKKKVISMKHVEKAIDEKEYRLKRYEERIQEMIEEGLLMIDIEGVKTGQINGLSVYSLGDYMFGKPSKITAEVSMGKSEIINIEREAGLGGQTYNKGVLILSGYLRRMYAQDKPLAMTASLCFEQSYSGVDGDSASSTEIYCLLSALSGIPLRQDIAVTGSVNQKGEIQPIGGVNEKIEGFYEVCKAKGPTGKQGVMIPKGNTGDLMLRKDILDVIKKKKFHIWAIETIDQGIEILMGRQAGSRDAEGKYARGTVHYLVDQKLKSFAEQMRGYWSGETG